MASKAFLQQAYLAYFGRPADPSGLAFYAEASEAAVKAAFSASPESKAFFGSLEIGAQINAIYQNLFNRDAEPAGLAYWAKEIGSGRLSLADAAMGILAGAQNDDKTAVANKLAASDSFTTALNTTAEILGYAGAAAIAPARAYLKAVDATAASLTAATTGVDASVANVVNAGANVAGQTFTLTAAVDTITGTAGNDTINAEDTTLTALDVINGGAGNDVMNLLDLAGGSTIPSSATISSVETINVRAAGNVGGNNALDFSASNITGLTNLNVTQAEDVNVKAAKTTAVSVTGATGDVVIAGSGSAVVSSSTLDANVDVVSSGSISVTQTKLGTGEIFIDGGTDVTVNASGADVTVGMGIKIGNTAGNTPASAADVPTGAVTINVASKATDGDASVLLQGIMVEGGSSVTITQSVTAGADVATKSNTNFSAAQGNVAVTGTAKTTSVTVKQTAESAGASAVAAIAGVQQVDTVVFGALKETESVEVGGLIFTASKDLTAAEVAAAFANLSKGATQGAASAGNGVYSGVFGDYSTGTVTTASGVSSVQATAATAATGNTAISVSDDLIVNNALENDLTWDATVVTATNKTAGVTATSAVAGKLVIQAGAVAINGSITGTDVLSTVSLDAYGAQSTIASDALTTLTLANSANDITVTNTAAKTLALNLNNLVDGSAVSLDGGASTYTTLNITTSGKDSDVVLTAAAVEALTVAGDKALDLTGQGTTLSALKTVTVSGSAGLKLNASGSTVTAVSTAATTGNSTITVDADKATFTGGDGKDAVTLSATTVDKTVSLGGGDDSLTLASGTTAVVSTLSGGDGTDALAMDAADAETLSANTLFEGKIDGFEKIKLGQVAAGDTVTVDLANLDGISYVISENTQSALLIPEPDVNDPNFISSLGPGPGSVLTIAFGGGAFLNTNTVLIEGQAIKVDGVTFTATGDVNSQELVAAMVSVINGGSVPNGTALTANGSSSGNWVANAPHGNTLTLTDGTNTFDPYVDTGVFDPIANDWDADFLQGTAITAGVLAIDGFADQGTLELTGAGSGATVTMTDATGTTDSFNIVTKVDAANLDFGSVDVAGVETLNITATDTTPVNTTTGAATISKATLTVTDAAVKAIVVTGNSDLDLTVAGTALTSVDASAATGKVSFSSAVNNAVIKGGSAADTLTATGNSQKLHGGAGADTLVVTGNLTELTGGAGADTFNIGDATTNVNSYATITDLAAGDKIKFSEGAANFAASKVVLANTAVFQDYANAAIAASSDGEVSWFQFAGDTYIIENVAIGGQNSADNEVTFTNGSDIIVKITGLVDLSTASFSASADTLLIA